MGGRRFVLRYAYAARYQMTRWGKNLGDATGIEIAAACAGEFVNGQWRSTGFERALDFADLVGEGEEIAIIEAVSEALKKAYPETTISTRTIPGETDEATKTETSTSGPLPLPQQDLA